MNDKKKIPPRLLLASERMPRYWYNVTADMPVQPAPCRIDGRDAAPDDFARIYGSSLAAQEFLEERYLDIPAGLREMYLQRRPTTLLRAYALEKELDTPAHIYLKLEESRPYGAANLPTLGAQLWFMREDGIRRVNVCLSDPGWACSAGYLAGRFGMSCVVYATEDQLRRFPTALVFLRACGCELRTAEDSRAALREAGDGVGCLSQGFRAFSLMHQTLAGIEARTILEEIDEYPDMIVGTDDCGIGFAGIAFPFMQEKLAGRARTQFVLTESTGCPICTKGVYAWDRDRDEPFLSRGYTLGADFPFVEGAVRRNCPPVLSELVYGEVVEPAAIPVSEALDAAMLLARVEGILPSTASALAVGQVIREAKVCRETETPRVILAAAGTGDFDLNDFAARQAGADFLPDEKLESKVAKAMAELPR